MSDKGNVYSDKDLHTISDFATVFDSGAGKRVLSWLEQVCHVRVSLEPEEVVNKQLEVQGEATRVPIDPLGLAKRQGMRSVFYKVSAMVDEAVAIKNRESIKNE